MPVVVLAKMKAGQVEDWKRLDEVWALVGDKPAFAKYVRGEIERMLAGDKQPTPAVPRPSEPTIPVPAAETLVRLLPRKHRRSRFPMPRLLIRWVRRNRRRFPFQSKDYVFQPFQGD